MADYNFEIWFNNYKEIALSHRYIHREMIAPLMYNLKANFKVEVVGFSVNNLPIETVCFGKGSVRILMWSQMHGNESTTTKAIFDLIKTLQFETSLEWVFNHFTVCIIPILNPDGALAYTRVNANQIDLNRDAQDLSQPESAVLRKVYNHFKPDYCFNLHGQRTIFGAGNSGNVAVVSFLAPAQDKQLTISKTRAKAMSLISGINDQLQVELPNCIGLYDDAFNLNCVGDTFQSFNTPTILIEAGHYPNDYARDVTRKYIYKTLLFSLVFLRNENELINNDFSGYQHIPLNEKCFFDVIIRNAKVDDSGILKDVAFQFSEVLEDAKVVFKPVIHKIGDLSSFFGHKEINAQNNTVQTTLKTTLFEGYENVLVLINNEKINLLH